MSQSSNPLTSTVNREPVDRDMRSDSREAYPSDADHRVEEETLRLVQQVFWMQTQDPPSVVIFTAVDHGSGCSRVCVSTAKTLAQNSRRVCLVDANFRSPTLPAMLGVVAGQGLTEALLQPGPVSSFARPVVGNNLWLLSSGTLAVDSPNLLSGKRLGERLIELRGEFDFVVIDTPPLDRYSDALVVSQHSDGVVLVLEAGSTRREPALAVVSTLKVAGVSILAAVLNKHSFPIPRKLDKYL